MEKDNIEIDNTDKKIHISDVSGSFTGIGEMCKPCYKQYGKNSRNLN